MLPDAFLKNIKNLVSDGKDFSTIAAGVLKKISPSLKAEGVSV